MSRTDSTKDILYLVFAKECDAVGPTVMDRVVQGQPVTPPGEGRRMDLTGLIELLAAAVTFINSVLELWNRLKAMKGRNPSKEELLAAARENPPPTGGLTKAQQAKIIDAVMQEAD